MSDISEQVYQPGEIVPESGIYECDCGKHHEYSTDVRGHRFPPLQEACSGSGWKLKEPAHAGTAVLGSVGDDLSAAGA